MLFRSFAEAQSEFSHTTGKSAALILEPVWNERAIPLVSSICSHAPASVLMHGVPIYEDEQGMRCAATVSQGLSGGPSKSLWHPTVLFPAPAMKEMIMAIYSA